jgi:hypothetical protein
MAQIYPHQVLSWNGPRLRRLLLPRAKVLHKAGRHAALGAGTGSRGLERGGLEGGGGGGGGKEALRRTNSNIWCRMAAPARKGERSSP